MQVINNKKVSWQAFPPSPSVPLCGSHPAPQTCVCLCAVAGQWPSSPGLWGPPFAHSLNLPLNSGFRCLALNSFKFPEAAPCREWDGGLCCVSWQKYSGFFSLEAQISSGMLLQICNSMSNMISERKIFLILFRCDFCYKCVLWRQTSLICCPMT